MSERLVFVPISAEALAQLAVGTPLAAGNAFTVTSELIGDGPDAAEEAEHLAMLLASVAALSSFGERKVVVATAAAPLRVVDAANGLVDLGQVSQSQLRAFFTEDEGVDYQEAARAAHGKTLDEAWEAEAVQELLASADLLWHDVSELATWDETKEGEPHA